MDKVDPLELSLTLEKLKENFGEGSEGNLRAAVRVLTEVEELKEENQALRDKLRDMPGPGESVSGLGPVQQVLTGLFQTLPKFSGSRNEDVQSFIRKFDLAKQASNWGDSQTITDYKMKLEGVAESLVETDSSIPTMVVWKTFRDALIKRFKPQSSLSQLMIELAELYQGREETVADFATRIQMMKQKLYQNLSNPGENEVLEGQVLAQFKKGLSSEDSRRLLSWKDCDQLEAAVEIAIKEEYNEKGAMYKAKREGRMHPVRTREQQGDKLEDGSRSGPVPIVESRNYNCFLCGKEGHMARNCWFGGRQPDRRSPTVRQEFPQESWPRYQPN